MVIALSPALIMMLVGSLCFFLIEVFYRGKMEGSVRWVMFWFVVGIVLVGRIAIEKSSEYAALYGIAYSAAQVVGPSLGAWVVDRWGFSWNWAMLVSLGVLTAWGFRGLTASERS